MTEHSFQAIGAQLESLQSTLTSFEEKLMNNERSSYLKSSVEYYRSQTNELRRIYIFAARLELERKAKELAVETACPMPVMPVSAPVPQSADIGQDDDEDYNPFHEVDNMANLT